MIHRNLSARAWVLIYATLCGLMLQSVHGEKIPLEVFRGERLQIEKWYLGVNGSQNSLHSSIFHALVPLNCNGLFPKLFIAINRSLNGVSCYNKRFFMTNFRYKLSSCACLTAADLFIFCFVFLRHFMKHFFTWKEEKGKMSSSCLMTDVGQYFELLWIFIVLRVNWHFCLFDEASSVLVRGFKKTMDDEISENCTKIP